ncbi:MAG: DUF5693 family protein [Candidatus Marinamargulisbacteria bacterium]
MKIRRVNTIVSCVFIGIAVVVSFNILLKRLSYDAVRHSAQYALTTDNIMALQEWSGNDQATMLAILKNQVGVSTILVPEPTLETYEQLAKVTVLEGHQIINTLRVGQLYRTVLSRLRQKTAIQPNSTYIVVDEVDVYKRIVTHLRLYFPRKSIIEHSGQIIQVNFRKFRLMPVPLGFNPIFLKSFASFGFNIVPQFKSYDTFSEKKWELMFSELANNSQVAAVAFDRAFKFNNHRALDTMTRLIQHANFRLVIPEFSQYTYLQADRLTTLAKRLTEQVVISHELGPDSELSFSDAYDRYIRALNNRSPQLIVFPFNSQVNDTNLYDKNMVFMKKVMDTFVRSGGESRDTFLNMPVISLALYETATIGLGIFSALYMLISTVHRLKGVRQRVILVGSLMAGYAITLSIPAITIPVFGLLTAVIAPVIGMVYFFPDLGINPLTSWLARIGGLLKYMTSLILICLIGVLFLVALHCDPLYLNNVQPFWGVKLALLLPIFFVGSYYFCGPLRINSILYVIRRVFRSPMTLYGLMTLFALFFILLLYIFRSGNYLQLLTIEGLIRSFLEDVFVVRPRFKAFLIGYPALILAFWFSPYFSRRGILWLLNALGVIGLTSFINSFCHFHTPVLISLYRGLIGLALGCCVAIGIYYICRMVHSILNAMSLISRD